jgi:2-keto-3-deoxy-L-rhamnonate aldolase RhmA
MEPNRFKTWLRQPPASPPLGTWLMTGAPSTAEAMGFCGFDFLVVDMEHVPIEVADAISILRTIAGTPAEPVVRLSWNDQVLVKRMLDAGARTLMFPFIQTAEEAKLAVSYTRYPPNGIRGMAGVHRGSRYGQAPDYFKTADEQIAVILQLETPEAVERTAEIAAVDGVDALFLRGHGADRPDRPSGCAGQDRPRRRTGSRRRQDHRHRRPQSGDGPPLHRLWLRLGGDRLGYGDDDRTSGGVGGRDAG